MFKVGDIVQVIDDTAYDAYNNRYISNYYIKKRLINKDLLSYIGVISSIEDSYMDIGIKVYSLETLGSIPVELKFYSADLNKVGEICP
jgi:hypothetical protein